MIIVAHRQLDVADQETASDLPKDVGAKEQLCTRLDTPSVYFTSNPDPTVTDTSQSVWKTLNQVDI